MPDPRRIVKLKMAEPRIRDIVKFWDRAAYPTEGLTGRAVADLWFILDLTVDLDIVREHIEQEGK